MYINILKCDEYGLDPNKVESISRRLSKAAKEAQEMGLVVFGGSGSGSLRFNKTEKKGQRSEVASLDGIFDGGDGGDDYD